MAEERCAEVNRINSSAGGRMGSDVAYLLGRIRMRQSRYVEAVRIMALNPEANELERRDLALCYVKVGDLSHARALYDPRLITDYNSAFPDAGRFLPSVRSATDLEAALLWCKGVALSNVGRADEATDCYATALRRFPENGLLGARLGLAADNAGRVEDAARGFAAAQASGDRRIVEATAYDALRTAEIAKAAREKSPGRSPSR